MFNLGGKTYKVEDIIDITFDEDECDTYNDAGSFDVETSDGNIYTASLSQTDDETWLYILSWFETM